VFELLLRTAHLPYRCRPTVSLAARPLGVSRLDARSRCIRAKSPKCRSVMDIRSLERVLRERPGSAFS
jgi:hypothetical protein